MTMPALSLHQPWASLCVTRQPCGCGWPEHAIVSSQRCATHPMFKRFETRSWPCPPALIGQPLIFHATKRRPEPGMQIGDYQVHSPARAPANSPWELWTHVNHLRRTCIDLPLGAIVGSGRVAACLPIVDSTLTREPPMVYVDVDGRLIHWRESEGSSIGIHYGGKWDDISDQLPYGDFTPGRYAWLIEDAAPTTERCPWCWGETIRVGNPPVIRRNFDCPVCDGAGRCDPIPARGAQRVWNWEPS